VAQNSAADLAGNGLVAPHATTASSGCNPCAVVTKGLGTVQSADCPFLNLQGDRTL
jgi:hypothetical protein